MAKTSSSKCTGFSLAFARGLRWWQAVAAHMDFQTKTWQQKQQWMHTWIDLFQWLLTRGMKNPKGFSTYL
jgi:hypothetical protein